MADADAVTVDGKNVHVENAGTLLQENDTWELNPPIPATLIVKLADCPARKEALVGCADKPKSAMVMEVSVEVDGAE